MPPRHIETRNIVFHHATCERHRSSMKMNNAFEAITRRATTPSSAVANSNYRTEKLEKEVIVRKRRYVWTEARFVRAMMRFRCEVRVTYDGNEADGKSVLDLLALAPPDGSTVRVSVEGRDAADAMRAVERLIESHFEED
jgi:phosphocarrier protein HPr